MYFENFLEDIFYQPSNNYWIKHILPAFHGMPSAMDTANLSILTDFPASRFLQSHDFFYLLFFALVGYAVHLSLPVLPDQVPLSFYNRTFYKWNMMFILLHKIEIKLAQLLYPTSRGKTSALFHIYENSWWLINYDYHFDLISCHCWIRWLTDSLNNHICSIFSSSR